MMPHDSAAPRRVLHVTGDFPDPVERFKTPVIAALLDLTCDRFDHRVISLNRRTPHPLHFAASLVRGLGRPAPSITVEPFEAGEAVIYRAPPAGLFHASILDRLGDLLAQRIAQGERPDLIVGHKLAIEGIVVARAAQRLGIPYALSIQGDTDAKILTWRPDLRRRLARIYHDAAIVFPFSVWSHRVIDALLGTRTGPVTVLPCPTELDAPVAPVAGGEGLVSVFHLKNHKRKNLAAMVAAQQRVRNAGLASTLAIIGGGDEAQQAACQAVIGTVPDIALAGPAGRGEMQARLNRAVGFVLPSLRESFGLVFIEALFSGLPVIYPRGMAIDGFFDGAPFAIGVDARDPAELAAAMQTLLRDEVALKQALADWQNSDAAHRFQRPAIAAAFAAGLLQASGQQG